MLRRVGVASTQLVCFTFASGDWIRRWLTGAGGGPVRGSRCDRSRPAGGSLIVDHLSGAGPDSSARPHRKVFLPGAAAAWVPAKRWNSFAVLPPSGSYMPNFFFRRLMALARALAAFFDAFLLALPAFLE